PAPTRPHAPVASGACGGYRWPIKIATDPGASSISGNAQPSTIAELIALPAPPENSAAPRNAIEMRTYRLTNVTLAEIFQEHDLDYHLIVRDGSGHTMIAESPNPGCAGSSALTGQIAAVRSRLSARFHSLGTTRGTLSPATPVTIEGVGFFDAVNGTGGQARNGIELHPITGLCFGENCSI
ncbi:MAG: hypothetical protein M3R35_03415, partial [Candidatus Eremiobacteraeota bacterium]|nr:hypothetical protein [Candidatus Eremiobacteraeota bacterium]